MQSSEMFYLDENGRKSDAVLWADLLDNPEADEAAALAAVLRAMSAYGLDEADALKMFGKPGTAARLAEHRNAHPGA